MKSDVPKVLHGICGKPMLGLVLDACRLAGIEKLVVVVGHGKDEVIDRFSDCKDIAWVEQSEQKGTGHAVQCCKDAMAGFEGSLLVIAGDMPLVKRVTLANLIETRERKGDIVTLATTVLSDPTGYGRIVRDGDGNLASIVEEKNCTQQQREITEVNVSYYCFDSSCLFDVLDRIKRNPESGEYYLTDAVKLLREDEAGVSAAVQVLPEDAIGVNSRLDQARVSRIMQDRIQLSLMNEGVTIVDPDNTWIEADVTIGKDSTIKPFSVIGVGASIGERCTVGPFGHVDAGQLVGNDVVVTGNMKA